MRMMSKTAKTLAMVLAVLVLGSVMLVACARPGSSTGDTGSSTPPSSSSSGGSTTVDMDASNFSQKQITISKGASVTLMNSSPTVHIISNGTWKGSTADPAVETGAPKVSDLVLATKQSKQVGPFNTAGTFQLYCSVHEGMNLTIVVQ